MNETPTQVQFVYPSVKTQLKQTFIGTAIGLAPVAVFFGGYWVWEKIQEKRFARKVEGHIVRNTDS